MIKGRLIIIIIMLLLLTTSGIALSFPNQPITVLVPYTAGGGTDATARAYASVAGKYMGIPLIIENRPGAATVICTEFFMGSRPDGYTLQMGPDASWTFTTFVHEVSYCPEDVEVIAYISAMVMCLAINSDLPYETPEEFFAYVKDNPNELIFAAGDTAIEAIAVGLGDKGYQFRIVPYEGGARSSVAVAGGHAHLTVMTLTSAMPFHASGDAKILMTMMLDDVPHRFEDRPILSDNPEIAEIFDFWAWSAHMNGLYAPKGTPQEVLEYLEDKFYQMSQDEALIALMHRMGLQPAWVGRHEAQLLFQKGVGIAEKMKDIF